MAENERLDVLKNRRWLRVMGFIASNSREDEIVRRLTEAMYRTLSSVGKQIPLEQLLRAAQNHEPGLRSAVAECRHDFAEMIERVAAEPYTNAASTVAERYVEAIAANLENLRADLFQVARLAELSSHELPAWFTRHLYGSHVVHAGDSAEPWRDLMLRYRAEWLRLIEHGRERHLRWAQLVHAAKAA